MLISGGGFTCMHCLAWDQSISLCPREEFTVLACLAPTSQSELLGSTGKLNLNTDICNKHYKFDHAPIECKIESVHSIKLNSN